MANREPYNIDFCRAIVEGPEHCEHLKENDMCGLNKCVYNIKWVKYWEKYGVYPPEGGKDA